MTSEVTRRVVGMLLATATSSHSFLWLDVGVWRQLSRAAVGDEFQSGLKTSPALFFLQSYYVDIKVTIYILINDLL